MKRIPCPEELAIDPRPFGYLGREDGAYRRLLRSGTIIPRGWENSEARKRREEREELEIVLISPGEHTPL